MTNVKGLSIGTAFITKNSLITARFELIELKGASQRHYLKLILDKIQNHEKYAINNCLYFRIQFANGFCIHITQKYSNFSYSYENQINFKLIEKWYSKTSSKFNSQNNRFSYYFKLGNYKPYVSFSVCLAAKSVSGFLHAYINDAFYRILGLLSTNCCTLGVLVILCRRTL